MLHELAVSDARPTDTAPGQFDPRLRLLHTLKEPRHPQNPEWLLVILRISQDRRNLA